MLLALIMAIVWFLPILGLTASYAFGINLNSWQLLLTFIPLTIWMLGPLAFRETRAYMNSAPAFIGGFCSAIYDLREHDNTISTSASLFVVFGTWYFGRYFDSFFVALSFFCSWPLLGLLCYLFDRRSHQEKISKAIFLGFFIMPYAR